MMSSQKHHHVAGSSIGKVKVIKKKVNWLITEGYLTTTAAYVCQLCLDYAKDLETPTTQLQNIEAFADLSAACFQSSLLQHHKRLTTLHYFLQDVLMDDRGKLSFKLH